MKSEWIIDVLADLKLFAELNELPLLAEQLDDTAIVALTEIAAQTKAQANGVEELHRPDLFSKDTAD